MSGAGLIDQQLTALRELWENKRQLAFQALNLAMIVFSALMIWKGLCVVTYSDSPVVVVLSGSMETALQRGDILFLDNNTATIDVGDIIVFQLEQRQVPIVHRVLTVHESAIEAEPLGGPPQLAEALSRTPLCPALGALGALPLPGGRSLSLCEPEPRDPSRGEVKILTKGDNNKVNDRGLYGYGKRWLDRRDVLGVSWGYLPYAGMVTIMLNDYPWLKYVVVGGMAFFVLTTKET